MTQHALTTTLFAPDFYVNQQPGPGYDPRAPVRVQATLHLHNYSEHPVDLSGTGSVAWVIDALDDRMVVAEGTASTPPGIMVGAGDTFALVFVLTPARGDFRRSGSYRLRATFFKTSETRVDVTIVV